MAEVRSEIRRRLTEGWLRLEVDGQPLVVSRLTPDDIGNLYQVAALRAVSTHYRHLGDELIELLATDAASQQPQVQTVLAVLRRCAQVTEAAPYDAVRGSAEGLVAGLADADLAALCRELLQVQDYRLDLLVAFRKAVTWVIARGMTAFGDIHERGIACFRRLQPVMQTVAGRPGGAEIEAAIDVVEDSQDLLDELLAVYGRCLRACGIEPEQQPDLRQSLMAPDNQRKLDRVADFFAQCLGEYPDEAERLDEAQLRAASTLQTVVTAIRQIDQRFELLGVTA